MSDELELTLTLEDQEDTESLAACLAELAEEGDIFALVGEMGMGKSVFARAFIHALVGEDEDVPSPTFTLLQVYEDEDCDIFHFDLYRLESPEEAFELGLEDAFFGGISLIEWPDRIETLLPPGYLALHLKPGSTEGGRTITLSGDTLWKERLEEAELL